MYCTYSVQKTHTKGCRTKYIPGLTEESQSLYEAYKKQYSSNPFAEGTLETGNKFLDTIKEEKKKRWHTIKKLSNDPTSPKPQCLVNSNQFAHHLLVHGQGIYADDQCVTTQYSSFTEVENTIGDALDELTQYYRSNSLRANTDKTQL